MLKDAKDAAMRIMEGHQIEKAEASWLYRQPLEELFHWANKLRAYFCGNGFDLCTIINGKSGRCSEDCRFCAQSIHHQTGVDIYPLLPEKTILEDAKRNAEKGVLRYSIVASGKRLSDREIDEICHIVQRIRKETGLSVCVSFGLLEKEQFCKLKEAGVTRIHNNLETSRRHFPNICTTHTFEDKVKTIRAAQAAGLSVCSGGIMGMGETAEDRLDMAFALRELEIKSIPINILNAIPGTPLEKELCLEPDELRRIIAVYRFILPDTAIRLAGGRGLLPDQGRACFLSGANAAISGDMLTTAGITVKKDQNMMKTLGFEMRYDDE